MAVLTKEQILALAYDDPDAAHLEEIKLEKKERALQMKAQGCEDEEIKSEIWGNRS